MSDEIKKCEECGETEGTIYAPKKFPKMLCNRHYQQMYKHGKIMPDSKPEKKCEECGETNNAYYREKHKRILCSRHNHQMKKHGRIQEDKKRVCDECGETEGRIVNSDKFKRILCSRHYTQMKKYGEIQVKTVKKCDECGETEGRIFNSDKFKRVLCARHYNQMQKYGKIFKRTIFDRNDTIEDGEISYIILRNIKHEEVARAIVDTEDVETMSQYKWAYDSNNGYVYTNYKGKTVGLHRMAMNYTGKLEIDHIDRNKLDNRKENLRIVTSQENSMNKGIQANNTSGITGVSYNKVRKLWVAHISINKKSKKLYFKTKEEAIRERLLAEKEHYGDNAKQAHLFPEYNIA